MSRGIPVLVFELHERAGEFAAAELHALLSLGYFVDARLPLQQACKRLAQRCQDISIQQGIQDPWMQQECAVHAT